ncbi:ester cyclase [Pseudomaricurvus alkylphenolicus]|uniref:nuclear transport factor 2 family protein n=1 Tax=Pseudomaricurvus alkylphenolicus TaxID=1306991 RepID=UPI001420078A|nr:ester cyclase [Pseudomaricurvus alkylphenolicus]NIB40653.1 ester cyclase [Pseudomaricurvus alkylphenolicus]
MKDFDPHFKDLPDYILGITREIWEDRGVGPKLKRYYADDVLVRAPSGILTDNTSVTAATLQTLHEFPDRQLVGEDVIWQGNEETGFISSHRLISVMTHTGSGAYGKATGLPVRSRIIAECVVKKNQVVEEWLVRDQSAFANCLGTNAEQLALHQARNDLEAHGKVLFFSPATDVAGTYVNVIDDSEQAQVYANGWSRCWGEKEPAVIRELYAEGACVSAPGSETLIGHSDIDRFAIDYLASFPDARFSVDHLIVNRDPGQPLRIAFRWSVEATHTGWGKFGAPSGAPVYIMGLTQAYMVNGKVTMEWITIDEVALWKQIIAHRGLPEQQ